MAFDHVQFPLALTNLKSSPEFHTTITETGNGWETRNGDWQDARKYFNAGLGIKTVADVRTLDKFHRARKGKLRGFLLKDWADFQLGASGAPEAIATIASGTATYQTTKTYSDIGSYTGYGTSGNADVRPITKPNPNLPFDFYAGVTLLTWGTHVSMDWATGMITLTSSARTTYAGQILGVVGEFFTPVRFDVDRLEIQLMEYYLTTGVAQIVDVPIVEVRDIS